MWTNSDLHNRDSNNETPLLVAAKAGNEEIVQVLKNTKQKNLSIKQSQALTAGTIINDLGGFLSFRSAGVQEQNFHKIVKNGIREQNLQNLGI